MLLQEIVREFDEELVRLASLREIVSELAQPNLANLDSEINHVLLHPPQSYPEASFMVDDVSDDESDTSSLPTDTPQRPRRLVGGPVIRRARRRRPVETGAIASSMPTGPVVVSAATLERERTRQHAEKEAAAPVSAALTSESSNDLARALAQRWLQGDSASL